MKNIRFIHISIPFFLILAIFLTGCTLNSNNSPISPINSQNNDNNSQDEDIAPVTKDNQIFWHLKDIPADISETDLDFIATSGYTILMPEWGIDDVSVPDVINLLDRLEQRNIKIVLDAGFTAAAWDINSNIKEKEDGEHSSFWLPKKVESWVSALKTHPAVYGWDISNEAGENMIEDETFRITLDQLRTASTDVRSFDNTHPIIIRMHYWDEYDGDFNGLNPFDKGIADIVVLNLYSNYSNDGKKVLLPHMIKDSAQILESKIRSVDPDVDIWLSLSAYAEPPMFLKPTPSDLDRDIKASFDLKGFKSIGFFGWGSPDNDWYLPRDGFDLLEVINKNIN
jgi:hypothetical protein